MTNAQLYIAIGLPTIAVLASLVVSLVQISGIKADMREIRNDVKALAASVATLSADVRILTGKVYELMGKG